MRYEVTLDLELKVVYNVEADSDEEAIQKVKDTHPICNTAESKVISWSAVWEPIL